MTGGCPSSDAAEELARPAERLRLIAYVLSVVFIFTVPWEAAIHIPAVGRMSKALGLLAGVVWVASVIGRGRMRRPVSLHLLFLLLLVWSGLTLFWSIDPPESLGGFVTYLQVLVLLILLWDMFDTPAAIETALRAYVLGAYVSAGSIIVNFLTQDPARYAGHQRFAALGFQVDGIALIVATAAPAAWHLAVGPAEGRRPSRWWTLVGYAYVPIAMFALALTGTRGATLASLPTAILVFGSLRRTRGGRRLAAVATIVLAAVVVIAFAPPEMLGRIGSAWDELTGRGQPSGRYGDGNIGGRAATWAQSVDALSSRPFIGVGLDAHRAGVEVGKEAHNLYLSMLTETGIVGFALFAGVLGSVWTAARRHDGWRRRYWFAQLGVLAVGAMSLSIDDSKSLWIFIGLSVASAGSVVRHRPADPPITARKRSEDPFLPTTGSRADG